MGQESGAIKQPGDLSTAPTSKRRPYLPTSQSGGGGGGSCVKWAIHDCLVWTHAPSTTTNRAGHGRAILS